MFISWKSLLGKALLTTGAIMLALGLTPAQERSDRESAGINGPVRTLRIESRQLHAVTYRQWGVMVYTRIFDDKGRALEDAEYLPGGNPDIKSTSAYDERGNEIEHAFYVHDGLSHRSSTRYDAQNRKIKQLSFDANGKQTSKFIFRYDKYGKQIGLEVLPNGKTQRRSVATFDSRGNELQRSEYDEHGTLRRRYLYTYDLAGNKTSEVSDYYEMNGRRQRSKSTYIYNGNGDLMEEARSHNPANALDNKKTYKRDGRGNKIGAIETDGKGVVKERTTWAYEFDPEGNWIRAVISEWTDKAPNEPLQPTFEQRRIFGRVNDATIALWSAAREGEVGRVQELLRLGADVNASHPDGGTPLIKAADHGHRDVLQALLAAGALVDGKDAEGWTALMWCAERGRIELVNLLLAVGANPSARNEVGAVAIMPAALNGHIEVLKVLLEKGANVNAFAGDGSTALMVSAREGQTETVKFLLARGADPNLKTKDGLTALFFAATGGNIETVNALLESGVDVNARAKDGATPLMVAAERSEPAVLQLLIKKGANVNEKMDDGRTALNIAIQARRAEVAELLRKAGAK